MIIAIVGLGKMGKQIVQKLEEGGHVVTAFDRGYDRKELVNFFKNKPVLVWLMIPASEVDVELKELIKVIPRNSIIVDGGNSDFRLTKKRAEKIAKSSSTFIDVGTSGGVWGYKNGFSMMVGGDKKSFTKIEPVLKTLANPDGAYKYFGGSGAGHYVKMVHNAIEYGMMESLAEGYRLLKEGPYKNIDLVEAGDVWQHRSVITSWLNELTRDALKENPTLKDIEGVVVESGEARWALEIAKKFKIDAPSIQAAFDVRLASQKGKVNFTTKLLALMRNAFGGHKINGK